jgi:hypothetical protein
LAGQLTVGGTPTAVPHGSRNSCRRGRCIFLNFFDLSIYFFENQRKKYKKIQKEEMQTDSSILQEHKTQS